MGERDRSFRRDCAQAVKKPLGHRPRRCPDPGCPCRINLQVAAARRLAAASPEGERPADLIKSTRPTTNGRRWAGDSEPRAYFCARVRDHVLEARLGLTKEDFTPRPSDGE